MKYNQICTENVDELVSYIKNNYKADESDDTNKKVIKILHCVKDYIDELINSDITSIMITSNSEKIPPDGLKIINHNFDKAIDTIFEEFDGCKSTIIFKSENTFIVIIFIGNIELGSDEVGFYIIPTNNFRKYETIEMLE